MKASDDMLKIQSEMIKAYDTMLIALKTTEEITGVLSLYPVRHMRALALSMREYIKKIKEAPEPTPEVGAN